jgi:kinetochore protein Mis13/DSN1
MANMSYCARLQADQHSLEALLRPLSIPTLPENSSAQAQAPQTGASPLSLPSDAQVLNTLTSRPPPSEWLSSRLSLITASLGPTIDAFADGVHQIAQYRDVADTVAGRVLKICADKIEDSEKESRRHALGEAAEMSTPKDELGAVLRSLSKLER